MTDKKFTEAIKKRYSCRSYTGEPLSTEDRRELELLLNTAPTGPFGTRPGFVLIAAEPGDSEALRGLGTYGFIKKPAAFIVGHADEAPMYLEDFGYCMEKIILEATAMGLGTCWLGGTFTRSSFADKSGIKEGVEIPAVIATGYPAEKKSLTERLIRATAGSDKRKPADELFFSHDMKRLDTVFHESPYWNALEHVRIAPSASNKQPWRIVAGNSGRDFHLYLERTKNYSSNRFLKSDLQRVDMGIAMCHFGLAAQDYGLDGSWRRDNLEGIMAPAAWEYVASWAGA